MKERTSPRKASCSGVKRNSIVRASIGDGGRGGLRRMRRGGARRAADRRGSPTGKVWAVSPSRLPDADAGGRAAAGGEWGNLGTNAAEQRLAANRSLSRLAEGRRIRDCVVDGWTGERMSGRTGVSFDWSSV